MSTPTSLFLAPAAPYAAPDMASVMAVLGDLAIVGEPLGGMAYAAGAGFTRHVIYAGCSPYLVLEPPPDGSLQFCHVALHGPFEQPRLVTGPNTVKPRCPQCRARLPDWQSQLAAWRQHDVQISCPSCQARLSPFALDWRGHAVGGRVLIELRNVFPGEATPSDLLLAELERATGETWQYGWAAYLTD